MSVSCECCVLSGRGSESNLSLVQSSPTGCGVSECNHEASTMRPCPTRGCCVMEKKGVMKQNMVICLVL
jgi:hypothetical protein